MQQTQVLLIDFLSYVNEGTSISHAKVYSLKGKVRQHRCKIFMFFFIYFFRIRYVRNSFKGSREDYMVECMFSSLCF